jgi:hypothetical protein
MPSAYYKIDIKDEKVVYDAAKKLQEAAWSDYCDLDYWIADMKSGKPCTVPKNVMILAMKHLRDDLYDMSGFFANISEHTYEEKGE